MCAVIMQCLVPATNGTWQTSDGAEFPREPGKFWGTNKPDIWAPRRCTKLYPRREDGYEFYLEDRGCGSRENVICEVDASI